MWIKVYNSNKNKFIFIGVLAFLLLFLVFALQSLNFRDTNGKYNFEKFNFGDRELDSYGEVTTDVNYSHVFPRTRQTLITTIDHRAQNTLPSSTKIDFFDENDALDNGLKKNTSVANYLAKHKNVDIVETNSSLILFLRLEYFNDYISKVRKEILLNRSYKSWQDVQPPNKLTLVRGNSENFFNDLLIVPNVKIIVLPWIKDDSKFDIKNVFNSQYYKWSASDPLCSWIEKEGFTKAHWDAVYNRKCNRDIRKSIKPFKLEFMYYHSRPININQYWPNDGLSYPEYFFREPPPFVFYLTILQDAVINSIGDVISGGFKIVPLTCSHDYLPTIPREYPESTIYKEVFVITQFWGTSYFHKILEIMPRLSPYVSFLKKNQQIKIHAPEDRGQVSEMLTMLGINAERIITGIARAKVLYLPQSTPCGFPNVQNTQLLSYYLNLFSKNMSAGNGKSTDKFMVNSNFNVKTQSNKTLILIKRSGSRRFLQSREIENSLQNFSSQKKLKMIVFGDNPVPLLSDTISIFNAASVVVGPHGAGLANVIFCEKGTLVLEGVCNPPHVNMCFQFTSHILGLRYHAIPSKGGCERYIDIDPGTIIAVLEEFSKIKVI